MLTRLKVNGFKNLIGVDISFGPFTCVAGANGVGKSNLFDAIRFLSLLADKPLREAALAVRSGGDRGADLRGIFHRVADHQAQEIQFEVEMIMPSQGVDDLGQRARATATFLRYELHLARGNRGLIIHKECLQPIPRSESKDHLRFPHTDEWRDSVVIGNRTSSFISTTVEPGDIFIDMHLDEHEEEAERRRPQRHSAVTLTRTLLSSVTRAIDSPTLALARKTIQAWRLLQLEPSAMRAPDSYSDPNFMASNGAHLPATLARLGGWRGPLPGDRSGELEEQNEHEAESTYARIANRLSELIDDVHSVRVMADDQRNQLTLLLRDRYETEYEARSLSDGTLRFLALTILEEDPTAYGVLCLEEPENGIHPQRIPAMLSLLHDLATDPEITVGDDNPLRQMIVNSHSPAVIAQVAEDDLLVVTLETTMHRGHSWSKPAFRWLADTWRAKTRPDAPLAPGHVIYSLNSAMPPATESDGARRVIDRPEIKRWLPVSSESAS